MSGNANPQLAPDGQADPPFEAYQKKVIIDVVTAPELVWKMVGYRRQKGFKVVRVSAQPEAEVNYVSNIGTDNFPAGSTLAVPPQTACWIITSVFNA